MDYNFSSTQVQERMMRVGAEMRHQPTQDIDTIYKVAVATLKSSTAKQSVVPQPTKNFGKLFHKQQQVGVGTLLYFYTTCELTGKLVILATTNINELNTTYSYGVIAPTSNIPRLYR